MKKIFAILLLVLPLCMSMEAQVKATPNDPDMDRVEVEIAPEFPGGDKKLLQVHCFQTVEIAPEFPGGDKALHMFLAENVVYPETAKEKEISGRVYVAFVVEKDGSIGNPEIVRGIGGGCDEEVVRIVRMMPKWKPGRQKGKAVPVRCTLPVEFKLN